ncbi:hypothetical protein SLA2020_283700 [Shorea laevis]
MGNHCGEGLFVLGGFLIWLNRLEEDLGFLGSYGRERDGLREGMRGVSGSICADGEGTSSVENEQREKGWAVEGEAGIEMSSMSVIMDLKLRGHLGDLEDNGQLQRVGVGRETWAQGMGC